MHSAHQRVSISLKDLVDDYARVAAPRHPDAIKLLDYWRGIVARCRGFVIGRDIPVRAIGRLLKNIQIDEPLADGSDVRVRLSGTAVRRRFGTDVGGALHSELFSAADFRHHLSAIQEVIRAGQPLFLDSKLKRGAREELHSEVVLLPILDRDRATPLVLVGIFYFQ